MGDAEEYDGNGFASVSLGDDTAPEGKQLQLSDSVEQAPEGFPSSGGKEGGGGGGGEGGGKCTACAKRRCMNPIEGLKWFAENNFIMKIKRVIGWRFIIVTIMLYGFDQGGIENLDGIAAPFWFKERGFQPADAERALAWAGFSWEVKPIYGLMMDTLPLFGWHYKPYLFSLGLLGAASYLTIAIKKTISYSSMIALLFFGMNAVVWNDIAIDGVTSKHIKEYPEIDTELPSLQQFSLMTVGIIFTAMSGFIADWVGLNWIYAMCAMIKLSATIATLWIPEKREKDPLSFGEFYRHLKQVGSMFLNRPFMKMFLMTFIYDFNIAFGAVMYYWYEDVAGWSKGFLGVMNTIAYVCALIFIIIYATYLKRVRYRRIFIFLQLFQAALGSMDIILVSVAKDAYWGHFFAVGDAAAVKVVGKCKFIVLLAVIGEYMPDGGETTATALLMATANLAGGFLARFAGAALCEDLGIEKGNYDNLPYAIIVRSIVRILPIPFIPLLVPSGCSADKTRYDPRDLPEDGKDGKDGKASLELSSMKNSDDEGGDNSGSEDASSAPATGYPVEGIFRVFRTASRRLFLTRTDLSTDLPPLNADAPASDDDDTSKKGDDKADDGMKTSSDDDAQKE